MRLTIDFTRGQGVTVDGMQIEQAPADLIRALQAAHARDHELVGQIQQLHTALAEQNELLRTRTIERDHHATDAHLWACIIAYLVQSEVVESLPIGAVNAMEGVMLSADVRDEFVYLTIAERPQASEEGQGG